MMAAIPISKGLGRARRAADALRRKVAGIVPAVLENALFFGGLGSIVFGAWMIYRPLGPIMGGLFSIWVAFLISAERK